MERKKHSVKRRRPKVLRLGERMKDGSWVTFAVIAVVIGVALYFWLHRAQPVGAGGKNRLQ